MDESREQGPQRAAGGEGDPRLGIGVGGDSQEDFPSVSGESDWQLAFALAERLLDGEEVPGADPRTARLAGFLAAARDVLPGRPQDEAAALDAFRRAQSARLASRAKASVPGLGRRRGAARGPRSARVLAGSAVAVLTLGGVALAAQGGLPHPFRFSDDVPHTPSPPASSVMPGDTGAAPGEPHPPGASPLPGTPGSTPAATTRAPGTAPADPGTPGRAGSEGLCETYAEAEHDGTDPGRDVRDRLAQEAGGVARIDAYCATVNATSTPDHGRPGPKPHPDPHPGVTSPPASAAASPSARPSDPSSPSPAPASLAPHGSPAPTTPGHPRRR